MAKTQKFNYYLNIALLSLQLVHCVLFNQVCVFCVFCMCVCVYTRMEFEHAYAHTHTHHKHIRTHTHTTCKCKYIRTDSLCLYEKTPPKQRIDYVCAFAKRKLQTKCLNIYLYDHSVVSVSVSPWNRCAHTVKHVCSKLGLRDIAGVCVYVYVYVMRVTVCVYAIFHGLYFFISSNTHEHTHTYVKAFIYFNS